MHEAYDRQNATWDKLHAAKKAAEAGTGSPESTTVHFFEYDNAK
jgi:hypothetical protein